MGTKNITGNLKVTSKLTADTIDTRTVHIQDDIFFAAANANLGDLLDRKVDLNNTDVQCIAGGLVVGDTDSTVGTVGTGRIMCTGQTNPLIGVRAVDDNGNYKTPYFIQATASDDKLYIGPTSTNALAFDASGNMTSPANLTVGGTISEGGKTLANKYAEKADLDNLSEQFTEVLQGNALNVCVFNDTIDLGSLPETSILFTSNKIVYTKIRATYTGGGPTSGAHVMEYGGQQYKSAYAANTAVGFVAGWQGNEYKTIYIVNLDQASTAFKTWLYQNATVLTVADKHPVISTTTDSTSTRQLAYGDTFTTVDSIARDDYGHVTNITTKEFILPTLYYATCDAGAGNQTKEATLKSGYFLMRTGVKVTVKFDNANTVTGAKLKIGSAAAKDIYWHGAPLSDAQYWEAGAVLDFVYDGEYWQLIGVAKDNNKTYSLADHTYSGLMSSADKQKLDGIAEGATKTSINASSTSGCINVNGTDITVYAHPTGDGNKHIPAGGKTGQILKWSAKGTAEWADDTGGTGTTEGGTTVKQNQALSTDSVTERYLLASSSASFTSTDTGETYKIPIKCTYDGKLTVTAANGSITAPSFNATSDARLKENFSEYISSKSILDLPVYKFDFIDGEKSQLGCKAQDLQKICPELVVEDEKGYLAIKESKLVYLLLEEVKKLNEGFNKLQEENELLKQKLERLEV